MKVREVIQEFIPCEVCGNRDIKNFYLHILVHKGSQPYVKCGECEEEYYSTKAKAVITLVEDAMRKKRRGNTENYSVASKNEVPPLVKLALGL